MAVFLCVFLKLLLLLFYHYYQYLVVGVVFVGSCFSPNWLYTAFYTCLTLFSSRTLEHALTKYPRH